ncbi:hypothetical protein EYZ11_010809 [Aspergillus tanneri]|uniref:Uncharacterized protein n=1 Tax=Aspergillus tanneri TaxID=1220188 RepID=A0A4V6RQP2_9EURO|nr:hypothetical protein EYZ11_010809 [Aspergillus tanneri]
MSSDDAYMSFLDKANADLNNGRAQQFQASSTVRTETVDMGVQVPAPLTSVDAFYVSETDEPFEPVTLKWEGASRGLWPDAVRAAAIQASGGGEPGRDESVVEVKVYRVEVGTSRVDYYILALEVEKGLLVGLRAKAVES